MSGEIPPEFGRLTNLRYLFIEDNRLSGCVPYSIGDRRDSDIGDLKRC